MTVRGTVCIEIDRPTARYVAEWLATKYQPIGTILDSVDELFETRNLAAAKRLASEILKQANRRRKVRDRELFYLTIDREDARWLARNLPRGGRPIMGPLGSMRLRAMAAANARRGRRRLRYNDMKLRADGLVSLEQRHTKRLRARLRWIDERMAEGPTILHRKSHS